MNINIPAIEAELGERFGVRFLVMTTEGTNNYYERLITLVSDTLCVKIMDLKGDTKYRQVVDARIIITGLTKIYYPKFTKSRLARLLQKDHTSIIYYLRQYNALMGYNEDFQTKNAKCEEKLRIWL